MGSLEEDRGVEHSCWAGTCWRYSCEDWMGPQLKLFIGGSNQEHHGIARLPLWAILWWILFLFTETFWWHFLIHFVTLCAYMFFCPLLCPYQKVDSIPTSAEVQMLSSGLKPSGYLHPFSCFLIIPVPVRCLLFNPPTHCPGSSLGSQFEMGHFCMFQHLLRTSPCHQLLQRSLILELGTPQLPFYQPVLGQCNIRLAGWQWLPAYAVYTDTWSFFFSMWTESLLEFLHCWELVWPQVLLGVSLYLFKHLSFFITTQAWTIGGWKVRAWSL